MLDCAKTKAQVEHAILHGLPGQEQAGTTCTPAPPRRSASTLPLSPSSVPGYKGVLSRRVLIISFCRGT